MPCASSRVRARGGRPAVKQGRQRPPGRLAGRRLRAPTVRPMGPVLSQRHQSPRRISGGLGATSLVPEGTHPCGALRWATGPFRYPAATLDTGTLRKSRAPSVTYVRRPHPYFVCFSMGRRSDEVGRAKASRVGVGDRWPGGGGVVRRSDVAF